MKMIIGGAFQGKYEYAQENFKLKQWIDGAVCEEDEIFQCQGINHFHDYIKRQLLEGTPVENLAQELIVKNPEIIIISDEIGYGVVPLDRFEREYREKVGRICTELAAFSLEVHRIVCGVGVVIKRV
ncbi:bifunctional adenosylcobinamide kinase/adenosylcobinamide-phosphate guanylyltransferase [Anaerosacchariphilus polymeriproducens]|uniref:Adenosylcobinamide kinase n=1 Tax=Anaerosacchariphilus polymeriproducens TaxID=1812858 RepID=A0A371AYG8_9FIRM|nr:bifunctional adenosylcobinamide kinase/adenosylcobinamide-phosphate guanylyltransferase [Anaerosacchariphilus polymeriproducens]RDU24542.1 adenosylcobinamide kinase [Anaerosacchariphilus polymeriproducens]